jgi:hypothetical protein
MPPFRVPLKLYRIDMDTELESACTADLEPGESNVEKTNSKTSTRLNWPTSPYPIGPTVAWPQNWNGNLARPDQEMDGN